MESKDIASIEQATRFSRRELFRLGFSLIFIVGIIIFANLQVGDIPGGTMLVITHDAALARRAARQVEIQDGLIIRDTPHSNAGSRTAE